MSARVTLTHSPDNRVTVEVTWTELPTGWAPQALLYTPTAGTLPPAHTLPAPADAVRATERALAAHLGHPTITLEPTTTPTGARGRPRVDDTHYARVAAAYEALVAAGERFPVAVMASRAGRSKATVAKWVTGARSRGLLTTKVRP